jgi:hypothetical protein
VLAEVASTSGNLMPELSFGTHFFQDLVETNIFYVALFPEKKGVILNSGWRKKAKNISAVVSGMNVKYKDVVSVYDVGDKNLRIVSDVVSQKIICFSENKTGQK